MDTYELKLRRLYKQHLLSPTDKLTAVRELCGVQAQFFGNAVHALKIRCPETDSADFSAGLAKTWTLRGTVHVLAESDLGLFIRPERYKSRDWTLPDFWNSRPVWALTPARQDYFTDMILSALSDGPKDRETLKELCRGSGMTGDEEGSLFDPWGGGIRQLAERGFIVYIVCEGTVFRLAPELEPMPEDAARLELTRRYFTHMGPASLRDAAYFFGLPQRDVKALLKHLPVVAVECEGKTYYHIENGPVPQMEMPRCLFLAGFDQIMLAYDKRESPFLRPVDMRGIFNLAGIVHPALLLDGLVAGRWKRVKNKVTVTPFRPLSAGEKESIQETAAALWPEANIIYT